MPITSTHDLLDRTGRSPVPLARSHYCYLFPQLAEDPLVGCVTGTA